MAYIFDDEIKYVTLGGTNPKTGKANPSSVEGYYIGSEDRPNKFNKDIPRKLYKLQTSQGVVGIFGSGGLNSLMKSKTVGLMTVIEDTGEHKDVGKGFPMKVFKVGQDPARSIETADFAALGSTSEEESYEDNSYEAEAEVEAAPVYRAPTPPAAARPLPTADKKARLDALLKQSKTR